MTDDAADADLPPALSGSMDGGLAGFFGTLAASWFLDFVGVGLFMQLTFHEFGHAAASWLSGRWAIPIPIAGFTFWGSERSPLVSLLTAAALAGVVWRSWKMERHALLAAATVGLLVMAEFAFLVPDKDVEMWMIYAGVAGEMILPALCMCAYFWEVSPRLRWDFWRYPLLLAAACAWLQSASLWSGTPIGLIGWSMNPKDAAVAHDPLAYLEWLGNTPGDNDQDAYRLVHGHGWTTRGIALHYRRIAGGTLALIAVSAALSLLPRRRRQAAGG